jgi:hypothetical protein
MATPNLGIPNINATDTGKYAEVNTAIEDFDGAFHGSIVVSVNPSLTTDFDNVFLQYMVFILTGSEGTLVTIALPAHARPFIVINETGKTVTFEVGSNITTAVITDANPHLLYSDGVANVYKVS